MWEEIPALLGLAGYRGKMDKGERRPWQGWHCKREGGWACVIGTPVREDFSEVVTDI